MHSTIKCLWHIMVFHTCPKIVFELLISGAWRRELLLSLVQLSEHYVMRHFDIISIFTVTFLEKTEFKLSTHFQILKEYRVPRPIDLWKQILVQHFAHQLEKIHLTLIVSLTLKKWEQRWLPLSVVDGLYEFADHWRDSVVGGWWNIIKVVLNISDAAALRNLLTLKFPKCCLNRPYSLGLCHYQS